MLKIFLIIVSVIVVLLVALTLPVLLRKAPAPQSLLAEYNRVTKPPDYLPENNAAILYLKAIESYVEKPETISAKHSPWNLSEAELQNLRSWLQSNSRCLELCRLGSQKPYCWIERQAESGMLSEMDLPELSALRNLAWIIVWQAELEALEHDPKIAFDLLIILRKMGCHLMDNGNFIEQVVGLGMGHLGYKSAFRIIGNVGASPECLTSFYRQLGQNIKANPQYLTYSRCEQLYNLEGIHEEFTDDGCGNGKVVPSRLKKQFEKSLFHESISYPEAFWVALSHPDKEETQQTLEQIVIFVNSALKETPWQFRQKNTDLSKEILRLMGKNYFLRPLELVGRLHEIQHQQIAYTSALMTTLAVLRHKADTGQLPTDLQGLCDADYLDKLPLDPYSDGPLIYRKTEDGFSLYSVGANFKDDGGKHVGWSNEGGDFVFWPVQKRAGN